MISTDADTSRSDSSVNSASSTFAPRVIRLSSCRGSSRWMECKLASWAMPSGRNLRRSFRRDQAWCFGKSFCEARSPAAKYLGSLVHHQGPVRRSQGNFCPDDSSLLRHPRDRSASIFPPTLLEVIFPIFILPARTQNPLHYHPPDNCDQLIRR